LYESNLDIVGVCTKSTSLFNSDHLDLSTFCETHSIPWVYSNDINSNETYTWLTSLNPDVIFCFGWSQMIKENILGLPPLGVIGFHPASLPRNRGRHPIIWSLALGLEKTASTFFFMDLSEDSGDIISQVDIDIEVHDDAGALYRKITESATRQLIEFLPKLESGKIERFKQDLTYSNIWRKRNKLDGLIDWRMSAETINNLVRSLAAPYVGAHFYHKGAEIKVWKSTIATSSPANIEPGKILAITSGGPIIKCGVGAICLTHTEPSFEAIEGDYL